MDSEIQWNCLGFSSLEVITVWFLVCKHALSLTFPCARVVIEILRCPVTSQRGSVSDFTFRELNWRVNILPFLGNIETVDSSCSACYCGSWGVVCVCVRPRGNEAHLSLPLNTSVSTPLPLTSPFQQGFLCRACPWSCCVCLSCVPLDSHTPTFLCFSRHSSPFLSAMFFHPSVPPPPR